MATVTYPGVYIEERPSGVRTITGVATSISAFIGRALRGPIDADERAPIRVHSFADFQRVFGGLWAESPMSYAVQQFFANGGSDALIIRVANGADTAAFSLATGGDPLVVRASSPGLWGNNLRLTVNHNTRNPSSTVEFNLVVDEIDPVSGQIIATETHRNLLLDAAAPRYVGKILAQESALARVPDPHPLPVPAATTRPSLVSSAAPATPGDDGTPLAAGQYDGNETTKTGVFALLKADLFNVLCLPPFTFDTDLLDEATPPNVDAILSFCTEHRAMLILDSPRSWNTVASAVAGVTGLGLTDRRNAAIYFPKVRMPDPLQDGRLAEFAPSGAIAGIWARTDAQRGVWKAPAGQEATITGARELTFKLTDAENGDLNPLGLNSVRAFPIIGNVVWGARTVDGADRLASEWKYIPVRRLALYIEESLFRGTQWVVFEPNDEPLWSQIRLNLGAFMQNLFRQGAFQGRTPREAYFVKCDSETTTQNDINLGIVNILVGFAPLKPAEFVVIQIQQMAGQVQA